MPFDANDVWTAPEYPATYREAITTRPDDNEAHYHCQCGFDDYVSEKCEKYPNDPAPLSNCPNCNTPFTPFELYS